MTNMKATAALFKSCSCLTSKVSNSNWNFLFQKNLTEEYLGNVRR